MRRPGGKPIARYAHVPDISSHYLFVVLLPGVFLLMLRHAPLPTLFPYTTLFRSPVQLCTHPLALLPIRNARQRHGSNRSEEHTSELQSRENLVCRLLLEKKNGVVVAIDSHDVQVRERQLGQLLIVEEHVRLLIVP